jgi:hypothetical protein
MLGDVSLAVCAACAGRGDCVIATGAVSKYCIERTRRGSDCEAAEFPVTFRLRILSIRA